jgi:hypothetical protein
MCRRGLPPDLDRVIEDARHKGEEVQQLSIGLDGDWFLRTDNRHGTSCPHDLSHPSSLTKIMSQRTKHNMPIHILFLT